VEPDERKWLEEAVAQAAGATNRGVVVLIRNIETPMIVTNATTPEMVHALAEGLDGGYDGGGGEPE